MCFSHIAGALTSLLRFLLLTSLTKNAAILCQARLLFGCFVGFSAELSNETPDSLLSSMLCPD